MSSELLRRSKISAILLLAAAAQSGAAAGPLAKLTVEAGKYTRIDTPVSVRLDNIPALAPDTELHLQELRDSQRVYVPSQVEPGSPPRLWWILSGATPAGSLRRYELVQHNRVKDPAFVQALENGRQANEGLERCQRYVAGWLKYADPKTGLIPKGLKKDRLDIWNAQDAAADNYPFMVLTAAITDRPLFEGRMLDMLGAETRVTSRIGAMPDTYSFSKQDFANAEPNIGSIIFGSSEYVKDGLLPLTEWLGRSPWSDRMISILDDMWKHAPVETPFGRIVSESQEINGEMLQTLSRVYWMTGDKKYLDWALRLGDYYLLDKHHPTRDETKLKLRDHGCEVVSGLCELYATVSFTMPQKKQEYQKRLHEMLDRILEIGRNEHGLFYNAINPQTGEHDERLADTWGYDLNGYYTVYLVDKTESYRQAALKALGSLADNYRNYRWEGNYSADGFADSIESAINLYNREPVTSAADWIDSETKIMWSKQQPDGVIEGWHGDGNFARTTIMYCLWKTKGVTIRPWRKDVVFGAVQEGDSLKISVVADSPWKGKILFDAPRHKTNMKMPLDWPRINQFPEWFTVQSENRYVVHDLKSDSKTYYTGRQLQEGITIDLKPGVESRLMVSAAPAMEVTNNDLFLEIEADGNKVLRYNHALVPPPEGADPLYTRSGFIHPLWSPSGAILTDIHPPDHIHHLGIWMPWTKTEFEGRTIDFWNLKAGQGTVRFVKFLSTTSGPVYGGFVAQQNHIDLTAPEGEKVVLNETWDVRVYNLGGPAKGCRLWDFVSIQHCAGDSPLIQRKYRYGGLGFRATRQWTADNSEQLTSEGKTREDGHGTRARWCDTYGQTADHWAGVTVMSHPANFRHPEPMRLWPRKNSHLFFNFAPSQIGDWTMEPGKDYVFRYRFYVHEGKPVVSELERLWIDFADPLAVKLEKIRD
ncbi:MAG TPA: PmoA family protein [Sedimentisphaerales bacterium]|nr:PmoA family protein [Sedimentisphaerales bacterium]